MRSSLIFALVLACLLAVGCAGRQEITVRYLYAACPAPAPAELPQLDREAYIADPGNVSALVRGLIDLDRERADLRAAVRCYQSQERPPAE